MTWLGRADGMEAGLVATRGVPFVALDAAPMVGVSWLGRAIGALRLLRGAVQAWFEIGRDRPDVLLVTGGFVSVPAALAARARRVPLAIYLPDVRPGRAVSFLARLADRMFVTAADAGAHIPIAPERVHVTGYPVRSALRETNRAQAREALGLATDEKVVLVFGGSQGARRLNEAVIAAADGLLPDWRVLHVAGKRDIERVEAARAALVPELAARWTLTDYLDGPAMANALHAADVAICRAGASVLGELPAAGLPAILVPLPIALGHQDANAAVLERAGAAYVVNDADWDGARLLLELDRLTASATKLTDMSRAVRGLDRPGAAGAIAAALLSMAGESAQPISDEDAGMERTR